MPDRPSFRQRSQRHSPVLQARVTRMTPGAEGAAAVECYVIRVFAAPVEGRHAPRRATGGVRVPAKQEMRGTLPPPLYVAAAAPVFAAMLQPSPREAE